MLFCLTCHKNRSRHDLSITFQPSPTIKLFFSFGKDGIHLWQNWVKARQRSYCPFGVFRLWLKNTNFIVFGLTGPGLKPTIDSIKGEQANLYTTDEVKKI
jgi:hypothetical protein